MMRHLGWDRKAIKKQCPVTARQLYKVPAPLCSSLCSSLCSLLSSCHCVGFWPRISRRWYDTCVSLCKALGGFKDIVAAPEGDASDASQVGSGALEARLASVEVPEEDQARLDQAPRPTALARRGDAGPVGR